MIKPELRQFILNCTALFVALDIMGTLPMYVSLTSGLPRAKKNSIINVSMLVALVVALFFVVLGNKVFRFLNIELFDFRIAGGLVLLLIALSDLLGKPEQRNRASGSTGIVPLAVPLITGPSVITTLIIQVNSVGYPLTIAALLLNYSLAWAALRGSDYVTGLIGKDGEVVISKITALLLAAIAIAMIRGGIFDAVLMFHKP